jgi:hypothetical protein
VEYLAAKAYEHQQQKRWRGQFKAGRERHAQYLLNLQHLAHMTGGAFAIAGALKQDLPRVAEMGDLLAHIVGELEEDAEYEGGAPQMLYDKWRREYRVLPPRQVFRLPLAS